MSTPPTAGLPTSGLSSASTPARGRVGCAPRHTPRARRIRATAAAAAGVLLLSGCGLIGVRTQAESEGGPVGISVAQTQGPEPSPTETGPDIPEGWELFRADFEDACASRVEVAVPAGTKPLTGQERGSFIYLKLPGTLEGKLSGRITCSTAYGDDPLEAIEFEKKYAVDPDFGEEKVGDQDVRVPGGYGYALKANADQNSTQMIGLGGSGEYYALKIVRRAEGRIESIAVQASAADDAPDAKHIAETFVANTFVDGQKLVVPDWP